MTLPEILVWQRVKADKTGYSFRKQHQIGPYLVDLYCSNGRSVIEIDGEVHGRGDAPQRDAIRDAFIIENGYRLLRIPAAEVLRDVNAAIQGIVAFVESPLHHPSDDEQVGLPPAIPAPSGGRSDLLIPPRAGEDLQ